MRTRPLGILSLICLVITLLWLVFLIMDMVTAGPLDTFEKVLAHVNKLDPLFYLTYANASLITVSAVILFAELYIRYKPTAPGWSTIGVILVPFHGALNLIVYLSQITEVPRLQQFQMQPEYHAFTRFLLRQVIQY